MMNPNYEVELIPYRYGGTKWLVLITLGGATVGRPRSFRTFYFAKRYHDKWERRFTLNNNPNN